MHCRLLLSLLLSPAAACSSCPPPLPPPLCAGVVHGDLKAANVLLTRGGEDVGGVWAATLGYKVTAKVADFGLALSLDPNDTHATMAARVSVYQQTRCAPFVTRMQNRVDASSAWLSMPQ